MYMPSAIPTAIGLTLTGLIVYDTVPLPLASAFFVNIFAFCFGTLFECCVSASMTVFLLFALMGKLAWFRARDGDSCQSNFAAPNLIDCRHPDCWTILTIAIMALLILARLYPDHTQAVLSLVYANTDKLSMEVATAALAGSAVCTLKLAYKPQDLQVSVQTKTENYGLLVWLTLLTGLYAASNGDRFIALGAAGWLAVLSLTQPTRQRLQLYLKLNSYILIPMRCFFSDRFVIHQPPASDMTLCISLAMPIAGALLHDSVTQHLAVTLFTNAVLFAVTPTALECALTMLMVLLSCIAMCMNHIRTVAATNTLDAEQFKLQAAAEKYKRVQAELMADSKAQMARWYGQMVSATAHDLRTPVAALKSGCSILRNQLPPEHSSSTETLDLMDSSLSVALSFLDSMVMAEKCLDQQDATSKELPVQADSVILEQLLREAESCILVGPGLVLRSHIAHNLSDIGPVICDRSQVLRSLINLMSNATRHTKSGSIDVRVEREAHSAFLRFSVTDTGSGVPDGAKQTIWEPFVSHGGSSGLGLFVVKAQCCAVGGDCGMMDNPAGCGSIFWFTVPLKRAWAQHNSKQGANMQAALRDCSRGILLIGDTVTGVSALRLMQIHLQNSGFDVSIASEPDDWFRMMVEGQQRLVLCDYHLGDTTGAELTRKYRVWEKQHCPSRQMLIYSFSAGVTDADREECHHAGMQGFLNKPLNIDKVISVMEEGSKC